VLGHSDIAPTRKEDPGELFDWAALARHGVGLWPPDMPPRDDRAADEILAMGASGAAVRAMQAGLAAFGYAGPQDGAFDAETEKVVIAFQRHFRPSRLDGRFDGDCRRRLAWLLAQLD
jgi:N-acetyl-anhydromuramyl-L-alanine amidase AmpD